MGVVRFDEIAKESRGTFRGYFEGMPIVGLEHIEPYDMLLKNWDVDVETTFTKEFHKGQIMFGRRRAYQHKACVATCDGICSGDITLIEPIEGMVYPDLLPFIVQNDNFFEHAIKGSNGALSPRVKWEHMANFEVNLPSLAEQKDTAEKLWAAYEVKQSYLRMIEATEEIVKSQFIEMFGTPENNHKKYPVIKIGEMIKSINYGTSKPATDNGKYVYLRMNNITYDGKLDMSEIKRIDLSPEVDGNAFVRKGDLMFNRTNTKEFVGKTAVFNLDEPMVVAGYIIRVCFKEDYSPEYVSGYLNSTYGKALLRKMAKGAVHQANINAQEFQGIEVLDVPKQEQNKYITILHQADNSISELRLSIDAIDKVIKSLINENL